MFSDDVAQVQAFDRIMEQLMTRKQRAEEILWATLTDVLYRHGEKNRGEEEKRRRARMERRARAMIEQQQAANSNNTVGWNKGEAMLGAIAEDSDEDDSHSYTHTANSFDDDVSTKSGARGDSTAAGGSGGAGSAISLGVNPSATAQLKRMVGRALLESEIDLEGDELRCLEEPAAWGSHAHHQYLPASYLYPEQALPRYTDPVLALRILVDCLTKLKRLDDVEQYLSEGIEREIRQVAEREQAKTFARLEKKRVRSTTSIVEGGGGGSGVGGGSGSEGVKGGDEVGGDEGDDDNLKEFRIHLNNLLKAFVGVMTRLMHLTQIMRHKIVSAYVEKSLTMKIVDLTHPDHSQHSTFFHPLFHSEVLRSNT